MIVPRKIYPTYANNTAECANILMISSRLWGLFQERCQPSNSDIVGEGKRTAFREARRCSWSMGKALAAKFGSRPGTCEAVICSLRSMLPGTAKVVSQPILAFFLRSAKGRATSVKYPFAHKGLLTGPSVASTRRPISRVDPTIRVLIGHALGGAIVGWAVLLGLMATDTAGLRSLLTQDLGYLALAVLTLQFGAGFATFAVVTALAFPLGTSKRIRPQAGSRRSKLPPVAISPLSVPGYRTSSSRISSPGSAANKGSPGTAGTSAGRLSSCWAPSTISVAHLIRSMV